MDFLDFNVCVCVCMCPCCCPTLTVMPTALTSPGKQSHHHSLFTKDPIIACQPRPILNHHPQVFLTIRWKTPWHQKTIPCKGKSVHCSSHSSVTGVHFNQQFIASNCDKSETKQQSHLSSGHEATLTCS